MQLPHDHAVGDLSSAVADAHSSFGDLGIPQILRAELTLRNLIIEPLADLVNGEQALFGLRIFRDDAFVRLRIRRRQRGVPGSASSACRGLRSIFLSESGERE